MTQAWSISMETHRDCGHLAPRKGSPCIHLGNASQAGDAEQVSARPAEIFRLRLTENKSVV